MQKSQILFFALIVLGTLGVYFIPLESQNAQEAHQIRVQFQIFKHKFGRRYTIEEEAFRLKVFKDNFQMISLHNADQRNTYKMGINQFGDITEDQFGQRVLTPNLKNMKRDMQKVSQTQEMNLQASPTSVDWRDKGLVTPVKNQGSCGSCWAFSITGSLQGAVAIRNKTLNNYSEQQLVDCCAYAKYGCKGCSGSWPQWAMEYVRDSGIVLQKQYPYTGVQDKCKSISTSAKILDHKKPWTLLTNSTTETVRSSLATLGPLSISVDAYRWMFYNSGVFSDCHDSQIDHAVLLVGYQQDGTWIVKNSWSEQWGQKGYIRIANKGSSCLIKAHVLVPHLA